MDWYIKFMEDGLSLKDVLARNAMLTQKYAKLLKKHKQAVKDYTGQIKTLEVKLAELKIQL